MHTRLQAVAMAAAVCFLGLTASASQAANYMKLDGIKAAAVPGVAIETWQWFVTPQDGTFGGARVAVGDITGDGMDPGTVALLLPAVQKVREAAALWAGPIPTGLSAPLSAVETALLVPAVQSVRWAWAAMANPHATLDLTTDLDPLSLMLLVPAVQKVREAAFYEQGGMGDLALGIDPFTVSLLLPAVQKVREAAARLNAANLDLPRMLDLPGTDVPGARFQTGWQLSRGQVTLQMEMLPAAAVPEPASWMLWLGAAGLAGALHRRRNARDHTGSAPIPPALAPGA